MAWKKAVCVVAGLGLCVSVASKTPAVEARFENPKTLLIEFREPMHNWDNALRSDLVRITPALPAKCTWDSDTRLSCHLESAAAQATRYRIELTAGLALQSGKSLGAKALYLETARPSVSARIARWQDGVPSIEVSTDMPVDAAALHATLRLKLDGKPAAFPQPSPLPPAWKGDTRVRFDVRLPAVARENVRLELAVRPGLRATAGPLPGRQESVLLEARLNAPFALLGVACEGVEDDSLATVRGTTVVAACMPGEPVHLVFSRALDSASQSVVERLVMNAMGSSEPDEDRDDRDRWFERESPFTEGGVRERPAQWLRIGEPEPGQAIDFALGSDVRSLGTASLPPVTVRIRAGDSQPHLRSRQRALVAAGTRVPPLVEAVNVGETTLDLSGVGLRSINMQVTARSPRQGSQPHPVRSADADRVLAEGGWVRWTPRQDGHSDHWRMRRSIEFAAPAFDLLALAGRREVLAWANEWDSDAPAAGALIELLWREPGRSEPKVVAQGRTGDDGTALLRLPDDFVMADEESDDAIGNSPAERPMWMLRATQSGSGARRAVLPAGEVDSSHGALGHAPERKTWGVSDRPMYRAGDTVHYRLWQRELDGTRLRAPRAVAPVMLRLQNGDNDKVVLEWQATPAVDGSLSGELALPVHLTDATHCIGIEDGYNTDGSCFFVGTYRAQDLWLEARSRGGVLRDGERFVADIRAGYFSGGPAAGAELTRSVVTLEPEPVESAYPQFDDFTFVAVEDDDTQTVELAGIDDFDTLDREGAVHIDLPVAFEGKPEYVEHRPAFGVLTTEFEASPEDREGTSAYEQATRYARFDHYVGLRSHPDWFGSSEPVSLEAVVITAHGKEVPDARVEVSIDYLASYDWKQRGTPVARCVLRVRTRTSCAFARERTGFYRLTARSGDAAPAVLQRYVWWRGSGLETNVTDPELTVVAQAQDGKPARLLQQAFARARTLLVVTHGGTILGHRVEAIEGNVQELAVRREAGWDGMLEVQALVREVASTKVEDGFRMPVRVESLETYLPAQEPQAIPAPVSLRFAPANAEPGTTARITVRNSSSHARQVTLSVMDDALRAQAQRWLPYADPFGPTSFRESLLMRGSGSVRQYGFDDWTGDEWRWMLPWADAKAAATALRERAQPIVAAPAPAAPASGFNEATTLDRIEVTGSRIKRTDIAESNEAGAPDPVLRLDREARSAGLPGTAAAIRSSFADTALWMPDIRLAPGESRDIEVRLPDNLTRWRAVAWSADEGAGFAMADAALEVGLPVEARLQAPVRIYPGDTSRVTTSVRHIADVPANARTVLSVRARPDADSVDETQMLALAPRGQGSAATVLHPETVGTLELVASASTPAGSDAVAGRIEVASPFVTTRKLQAGWIGEDPISLPLPAVPEHAHDPSLRVSLLRGGAGLTTQWTHDLRTYPHRCWEQILSRAVGAALAIERNDQAWPDAASAVAEALDNAAVFQLDDGGFVYFTGANGYRAEASITLTAYTLRAFALLRELGHRIPGRVESHAHEFLGQVDVPAAGRSDQEIDESAFASFAFAAAGHAPNELRDLDVLWAQWKRLSLPVQVASVQALARAGHPAAARATKRLLESAPLRGAGRSFRLTRRYDAWMSSDLREQCALIDMLGEHPGLAPPRVRRELLTGLNDLYAGGVASVDTQSAAYCLMALHEARDEAASPLQAHAAIGVRERTLQLGTDVARVDWDAGAPAGSRLEVKAVGENVSPASYVAELTYQEDASQAQASAVGLSPARGSARWRVEAGRWTGVARRRLGPGHPRGPHDRAARVRRTDRRCARRPAAHRPGVVGRGHR